MEQKNGDSSVLSNNDVLDDSKVRGKIGAMSACSHETSKLSKRFFLNSRA